MELISRQALIKDAESWVAVDEHERHLQKNVVEWLKEFPSAEHGTNLAEVGTDLISRQSAVDELVKMLSDCFYADEEVLDAVETTLKELPSAQPEPCEDAVSREKVKELAYSQIRSEYSGIALKEQREAMLRIADNVIGLLAPVASKQSEIIRCKDCQYWNKGSCECPEHAVNCQDYYVGDIETEAEYFCGYAERRTDE